MIVVVIVVVVMVAVVVVDEGSVNVCVVLCKCQISCRPKRKLKHQLGMTGRREKGKLIEVG